MVLMRVLKEGRRANLEDLVLEFLVVGWVDKLHVGTNFLLHFGEDWERWSV